MAKFNFDCPTFTNESTGEHGSIGYSELESSSSISAGLTSEDLLTILRPAAQILKEHYRNTILRLFKRRSGDLADSIQVDESGRDREYMDLAEASIWVGPKGKHNGSKRAARSRAGSSSRKYAKHNRTAHSTTLTNAELGYLLEFGTPRISATHWMENANEEISETVQQSIEEEFDKMLKAKGLI